MSYSQFRMINTDFPLFREYLKKQILSYADEKQVFIQNAFMRIPLMWNLKLEQIIRFMYSLKQVFYEENTLIAKEGTVCR